MGGIEADMADVIVVTLEKAQMVDGGYLRDGTYYGCASGPKDTLHISWAWGSEGLHIQTHRGQPKSIVGELTEEGYLVIART